MTDEGDSSKTILGEENDALEGELMPLPVICPECGTHIPPENHWCECGYKLDRSPALLRKRPLVWNERGPYADTKAETVHAKQGGVKTEFSLSIVQRLRRQFVAEWTWRLFVSLQVLGISILIYLDFTDQSWSVLPSDSYSYGFSWQLFESFYWKTYHKNWLAAICLVGPYVVAKAIDWIVSARD